MNNANIQSREAFDRQIIRALDNGVKTVEDIANGRRSSRCRPAREALTELYAYAEKCKKEDGSNGK